MTPEQFHALLSEIRVLNAQVGEVRLWLRQLAGYPVPSRELAQSPPSGATGEVSGQPPESTLVNVVE